MKNEEMLIRLGTLLEQQQEQNNKMQESLTDLVEKLANKPSQNVLLTDSVMVQETSNSLDKSEYLSRLSDLSESYLDDLLASA